MFQPHRQVFCTRSWRRQRKCTAVSCYWLILLCTYVRTYVYAQDQFAGCLLLVAPYSTMHVAASLMYVWYGVVWGTLGSSTGARRTSRYVSYMYEHSYPFLLCTSVVLQTCLRIYLCMYVYAYYSVAGACSQHFLYCILVFICVINNMIFCNVLYCTVRTLLALLHWLPAVVLSLVAKQAHTAVEAARPLLTQGPHCW